MFISPVERSQQKTPNSKLQQQDQKVLVYRPVVINTKRGERSIAWTEGLRRCFRLTGGSVVGSRETMPPVRHPFLSQLLYHKPPGCEIGRDKRPKTQAVRRQYRRVGLQDQNNGRRVNGTIQQQFTARNKVEGVLDVVHRPRRQTAWCQSNKGLQAIRARQDKETCAQP